MSKKVLILSASPKRDKYIDEMIAEELRKLGAEVWVHACLREGRAKVLELQPDIVVSPPIRNPYSRDFVEVCKNFGCGVVSRHTEASCDWNDYKQMDVNAKNQILGGWPYFVDKELVWGEDEAQILNQRQSKFKAIAVGSFAVDIYKKDGFMDKFIPREAFNQKYGFDNTKRNLLISCPWGFADSAPDLCIDDTINAKRDIEGMTRYLAMIENMVSLKDTWNILITLHPGVVTEPYVKRATELGLKIDTESCGTELLVHTDCLVHSGSTMAMEMHFMGKPAFQYGDVNEKITAGWFGKPSALSQVSPKLDTSEALFDALRIADISLNSNVNAIKQLEAGRYGKMDGKASERAAKEIFEVEGQFKFSWPRSTTDYDQLCIFKRPEKIIRKGICGICGSEYHVVDKKWTEYLLKVFDISPETLNKTALYSFVCPNCGAKFMTPDEM